MKLVWNRYAMYFLLLILTVFIVPTLFHIIPDKPQASLFAGMLFILLSLGIYLSERRAGAAKELTARVSLLFFLVCAMPIFFMRVIYWGEVFNELSLLGVPMSYWHKASNMVYIVLCLAVLTNYRQHKIKTPSES